MLHSNRFVLLAASLGLGIVVALLFTYRALANRYLIEHETRANVALSEVFANAIVPVYAEFIAGAGSLGGQLAGRAEVAALDRDVRRLMRGSRVVKVKVYDLRGLTVYSSDPRQIGEVESANGGFASARAGTPASAITFRDTFDAFEGQLSERSVVASYIPVRGRASDRPLAVFEVYSDVTSMMRTMQRVQWWGALAVTVALVTVLALLVFLARRTDALERRRAEEASRTEARIRFQAYHDPLTGLPNRANFQEQLEQGVRRAQRHGNLLAVMFLDLDRFKLVNDSFGHDAGDQLLHLYAGRLREFIRDADVLFRMGGDEFTILPDGIDTPECAARLAARILHAMEEPFQINGHSIVATTSIGISLYPRDDVEPEKLVKNADAAMYLAKEAGRNQYQFYTPELNERALDQLALESALQQALKNEEFTLHYQPRMARDGVSVVGAEALLRWQRAEGLLESPGRFIPVLEQTGLIQTVGEWVLYEACRQNREWQAAGHAPFRVSVNISSRQFRTGDFVQRVGRALKHTRLEPRWLELELTESVLLDNPDSAIAVMRELKELGVAISIDDFGTGYSSFNYLKVLPVDYLKIDRSFVRDVTCNARDAAIVTAIAALARALEIGLVAEGVELPEQAAFLIERGCDELQGFYYSRPVDAGAARDWLGPKQAGARPSARVLRLPVPGVVET